MNHLKVKLGNGKWLNMWFDTFDVWWKCQSSVISSWLLLLYPRINMPFPRNLCQEESNHSNLLIQIGVILLEEGSYHILYISQTFETSKPPMFVTVFFDASGTYWTPRAKAIQCLGYEGEDGGPGDYTPGDSLEDPWSPGALCRRWRLQFPQAICDVQVAPSVGTTRAVRSMCVASTLP